MTDATVLLLRHKPRLVYDSQEAYFADSAAVFTDSPTCNPLRRAERRADRRATQAEPGLPRSQHTTRTARRSSRAT